MEKIKIHIRRLFNASSAACQKLLLLWFYLCAAYTVGTSSIAWCWYSLEHDTMKRYFVTFIWETAHMSVLPDETGKVCDLEIFSEAHLWWGDMARSPPHWRKASGAKVTFICLHMVAVVSGAFLRNFCSPFLQVMWCLAGLSWINLLLSLQWHSFPILWFPVLPIPFPSL